MRRDRLCEQLENFELARMTYALKALEILTNVLEKEAEEPTDNAIAIAALGTAIGEVLVAVT